MLSTRTLRRPLLSVSSLLAAISPSLAQTHDPVVASQATAARDTLPSTAAYERFAHDFESALQRGDAATLRPMYDWDALFQRAYHGVEEPADARAEFFDGVRSGVEGRNGVVEGLLARMNAGGSIRFLRLREVEGTTRALFRLLGPEETGLDYQELVIATGPRGLRVVDVHPMLTGELLSHSLRRYWLQVAAGASRSLLERLLPDEGEFLAHFDDFQRLALLAKREPVEALTVYRALPEVMQRDRVVLVMYLQAASQISDQTYFEALARWRELFPADATADLHSIDAFYLKQEFAPLLAALERIERAVGGDPYLDVLRATALRSSNDAAGARAACKRAIAVEPDLHGPWWILISLSLEEQRFDETLELLEQVDARFRPEWTDLAELPEYAGFVAAPQHAQWLAYLNRN